MLLNVAKQHFIIILDNVRANNSFDINNVILIQRKHISMQIRIHSEAPLTKKNCCCVENALINLGFFFKIMYFKRFLFVSYSISV